MGAQNEYQWAVVDTCVDMIYAFITSVIASVILLKVLNYKEKKSEIPKETVTV